ncbi:hypothetical protein D3C87_1987420 [compost metagenome]
MPDAGGERFDGAARRQMDHALGRQCFEPIGLVACGRAVAQKERIAIDEGGWQRRKPIEMAGLQLRMGSAVGQPHVGGIERQQVSVMIA